MSLTCSRLPGGYVPPADAVLTLTPLTRSERAYARYAARRGARLARLAGARAAWCALLTLGCLFLAFALPVFLLPAAVAAYRCSRWARVWDGAPERNA